MFYGKVSLSSQNAWDLGVLADFQPSDYRVLPSLSQSDYLQHIIEAVQQLWGIGGPVHAQICWKGANSIC